jgi:hypothetical protein
LSVVVEDLTFDEFKKETPESVVTFPDFPKDGTYVVCNARVPNPNGGAHRTRECRRPGIISWKGRGCCLVEHTNGEQHTIGYDDAVNLKPAPIDQDNHQRILELSKAARGD